MCPESRRVPGGPSSGGRLNYGQPADFSREIEQPSPGTRFATAVGMSPVTRKLHQRFETVCRAELERLRRKTASLNPGDREEVTALSIEVTTAIAARVGAALDRYPSADLESIVAVLFAVGEGEVSNAVAGERPTR